MYLCMWLVEILYIYIYMVVLIIRRDEGMCTYVCMHISDQQVGLVGLFGRRSEKKGHWLANFKTDQSDQTIILNTFSLTLL